jgi:hypothetical protein
MGPDTGEDKKSRSKATDGTETTGQASIDAQSVVSAASHRRIVTDLARVVHAE